MKSSATTVSELFAKAAKSASKSDAKPELTKAGIALTAEARHKLQQLAEWIEQEIVENHDPRVRLGYHGGVVTYTDRNVTYVSPLGALVQMFEPIKLAEAQQLGHRMYQAYPYMLMTRICNILTITRNEHLKLLRYLYNTGSGYEYRDIIKALRTLK